MTQRYPKNYLAGVRLFNEQEFYACHDVLEELWTDTYGEERDFLQGLIQAAVALFHFGEENLGGARKLYRAAREKLEPYEPSYMGLDLDRFLAEFHDCFQELLDAGNVYPTGVRLREERIPKLHLDVNESLT